MTIPKSKKHLNENNIDNTQNLKLDNFSLHLQILNM